MSVFEAVPWSPSPEAPASGPWGGTPGPGLESPSGPALESPFATASLSATSPAAAPDAFSPGRTESPFRTGFTPASEAEREAQAFHDMLAELEDEQFDEAVAHLVDEAAGRHLASGAAWSSSEAAPAMATAELEAWIQPLQYESDRMLENMAGRLASEDLGMLREPEFEALFESLRPDPGFMPEAFENFLGGVFNVAKKLVKGAVSTIGKVASLPVRLLLGKLRALVGPMLRKVVATGMGLLPAWAQTTARSVAARLGAGGEAESLAGGPDLSHEFLVQAAGLALAPSEAEADEIVSEATAEAAAPGSSALLEVDQARAHLAQQLASLPPGREPVAEVEQFLPVIMAAQQLLKMGIKLIGRDKVVSFLGKAIAGLIKGWVGQDAAIAIGKPIADTGLKLLGMEAAPLGEALFGELPGAEAGRAAGSGLGGTGLGGTGLGGTGLGGTGLGGTGLGGTGLGGTGLGGTGLGETGLGETGLAGEGGPAGLGGGTGLGTAAVLGSEALASTVEETVRDVLQLPAEAFEDPLRLEAEVQEAFAAAAARNIPADHLRPDLPQLETAGEGGVWVLMPRAARPRYRYKKYSRVFYVPVTRQMAGAIGTRDGGTLETLLADRGVTSWPAHVEVHLYEALPGTHLGHIAEFEAARDATASETLGELQPFTPEAAALLTREPRLGHPVTGGYPVPQHVPPEQPMPVHAALGHPGLGHHGLGHHGLGHAIPAHPAAHPGRLTRPLAAGNRYFRVRMAGQSRPHGGQPRHRFRVGFERRGGAPTIHVHLHLSEREAQELGQLLHRGALPATVSWLKHRYHHVAPAILTARLLRHGAALLGAEPTAHQAVRLALHLTEAITQGMTAFARDHQAELVTAVQNPAQGLTFSVTFHAADQAALAAGRVPAPHVGVRAGFHSGPHPGSAQHGPQHAGGYPAGPATAGHLAGPATGGRYPAAPPYASTGPASGTHHVGPYHTGYHEPGHQHG